MFLPHFADYQPAILDHMKQQSKPDKQQDTTKLTFTTSVADADRLDSLLQRFQVRSDLLREALSEYLSRRLPQSEPSKRQQVAPLPPPVSSRPLPPPIPASAFLPKPNGAAEPKPFSGFLDDTNEDDA